MEGEDCLARIRRGGAQRAEAIDELFRRYHRSLAAFFRNHGVPAAEAQELVQQTFLQLVTGVDRFRGDCPLSVWLWRIARNAMISHFRRSRPDSAPLPEDPPAASNRENPDDPANLLADCVADGFHAFARDHPERADVLRLAVLEGWGMKDIAAFLDRTEGATREYVSQCRKHLRPYLEPCYDE